MRRLQTAQDEERATAAAERLAELRASVESVIKGKPEAVRLGLIYRR